MHIRLTVLRECLPTFPFPHLPTAHREWRTPEIRTPQTERRQLSTHTGRTTNTEYKSDTAHRMHATCGRRESPRECGALTQLCAHCGRVDLCGPVRTVLLTSCLSHRSCHRGNTSQRRQHVESTRCEVAHGWREGRTHHSHTHWSKLSRTLTSC